MSEAATRWAWRWLLAAAAAAARLGAEELAAPSAAVTRGVRVDFAASPRAAAASADAAREAAVRFEGAGWFVSPSAVVVAAGFLGAGFDVPVRAAVDFAAVDLAAADFAAVDLAVAGFAPAGFGAAGFTSSGFASACSASACSAAAAFAAADLAAADFAAADFAAGFAAAAFAAGFAAAGFAAAGFAAAALAAADFAAGLAAVDLGAADLPAAVLFVAPERAGVDEVSAAAPVGDSPASGTPVPVPSAASSSWLERETEVTKPTYQDGSCSARSGLLTRSEKLGIS
ncbi:hypothetical protein [Agromyces sp. ISL-38]|uniref:hypothetical protein n=1 Tax=Agromyces sp. ISL-38 TaxID=2819107 RepID=UPI002557AAA0|nr:hypothetical protein [Agromyces sp. ISL-38]